MSYRIDTTRNQLELGTVTIRKEFRQLDEINDPHGLMCKYNNRIITSEYLLFNEIELHR